jgi:hypothetical protein
MTPIRRGSGKQHVHRKSESYRQHLRRKLAAYELWRSTKLTHLCSDKLTLLVHSTTKCFFFSK